MTKKEWNKPEVRKIEAGSAENSNQPGQDPGTINNPDAS